MARPSTPTRPHHLRASDIRSIAQLAVEATVGVSRNSGLSISTNGELLSSQLDRLLSQWPTAVEELSVIAHSMGGLVIRSAVHAAGNAGHRWTGRLKSIVFLGTPHHGALLEQAGAWVDAILASTRFTAPFVRIGRLRSAGIMDLRHGTIVGAQRHHPGHPGRHLPLPEGVACFAVAATTAAARGAVADRLVGDGLVPLPSALGIHDDPGRCLGFPESSQRILHRMNHLGLLTSPIVAEQILEWLGPKSGP